MSQLSFLAIGQGQKKLKCERFLDEMSRVIPWKRLCRLIEPSYMGRAETGRIPGTIVDATLIASAKSTKNKNKRRDPEMSSTKKSDQWHFGMKAHIISGEENFVSDLIRNPST